MFDADALLAWSSQHSEYALGLVFALAFLEACPGIGLFVSGAFLLSLASLLYSQEIASLSTLVVLAMSGALLSDQFGFYLGRSVGGRLLSTRWMQSQSARVASATSFLQRFGAFAVIMGRLVTMIRSLVPLMMGVAGFPRLKFLMLDVVGCCVWGAGLAGLVLGLDNLMAGWFANH